MVTVRRKPWVLLTALVALVGIEARPARGQNIPADRFRSVVRYWEWSSYWRVDGLDFPAASFKPGLTMRALEFAWSWPSDSDTEPCWGFCSRGLSVCQA